MRIFLNDFELNNPANRVYVNEDIEGFDIPDIRSSRGIRSGQSGGYFGAQFYDPRHVTISGSIFSSNTSEALEKRREIQAALPLYPDQIVVTVIDDDGRSYTFDAQVIDFKMPIKRGRMKSLFKLELEAPDHILYDSTAGELLSFTINKAVPGGMLFSDESPVFGYSTYFTDGMSNAVVNNAGKVEIYPVITINGKTANPVITNNTTGDSFRMSGYSVPDGSVTVIDMRAHTITLNGGNAYGYWDTTSQWVSLVPGENEFTFTSDNPSDVSMAVGTYLPGLLGI